MRSEELRTFLAGFECSELDGLGRILAIGLMAGCHVGVNFGVGSAGYYPEHPPRSGMRSAKHSGV